MEELEDYSNGDINKKIEILNNSIDKGDPYVHPLSQSYKRYGREPNNEPEALPVYDDSHNVKQTDEEFNEVMKLMGKA